MFERTAVFVTAFVAHLAGAHMVPVPQAAACSSMQQVENSEAIGHTHNNKLISNSASSWLVEIDCDRLESRSNWFAF